MSIATLPHSDREMSPAPPATRPVSAGLTLRAVVIGCVFTILLTIWSISSEFVTRGSFITVTHLPVAALLPFLLMVLLVNPCLKLSGFSRPFTSQELIVIFFLVFTASVITRLGLQQLRGIDHQRSLSTTPRPRTGGPTCSSTICRPGWWSRTIWVG